MRNVRLHLRVLVLALTLMLVVPTVGRIGADRLRPGSTTAVAAAADPAPVTTPAPRATASTPEDDGTTATTTRAGDGEGRTAPEADTAPTGDDAETGDAPATDDAPAEADADVSADARATATDEARSTTGATPDASSAPAVAGDPEGEDATPAAPTTAAPAKATPGKGSGKAAGGRGAPARTPAAAAPAGEVRSLYLAIGHGRAPNGRWQPGAEHTGRGVVEVDAAAVMVEAMHEVLAEAPNLELHVESATDHPNVVGSVAAANARGVDDCIEVHQDTAAAPPGAFVHWYPGATSAKNLADRVIRHIEREGVGIRHDWHRPRPGLYMLRKSTCRSILVEVGRVGDFDTKKLQELGRAMARAYLRDTREVRGVGG